MAYPIDDSQKVQLVQRKKQKKYDFSLEKHDFPLGKVGFSPRKGRVSLSKPIENSDFSYVWTDPFATF